MGLIVTPAVLRYFAKSNQRSLSRSEVEYLENMKFGLLCSWEAFTDVSDKDVLLAIDKNKYYINKELEQVYNKLVKHTVDKNTLLLARVA